MNWPNDEDEFRERVRAYLTATLERWATLDARHALDIALDISGPDDAFEGANIQLLEGIINEWLCDEGRP